MSDVFYEMSKVTIKPVVNYIVLQIFLISSLNFTFVVAFCTVAGNISYTFTPPILGLFKYIAYLYLVPFLNLTFLLLRKFLRYPNPMHPFRLLPAFFNNCFDSFTDIWHRLFSI